MGSEAVETCLCSFCGGMGWHNEHVYGRGISGWRQTTCRACGGAGEVDESQAAAVERGKLLREDRKARGLTLAQEASRLGITAAALSKLEWGRGNGTDQR